jgi:hypothetical protein
MTPSSSFALEAEVAEINVSLYSVLLPEARCNS